MNNRCQCNLACHNREHWNPDTLGNWIQCTSENALGIVFDTSGQAQGLYCWPCGKTRVDYEDGYRGWLPYNRDLKWALGRALRATHGSYGKDAEGMLYDIESKIATIFALLEKLDHETSI